MRTRTDRYQLADTAVWRVGYGAMQLAGPGVFGPPDDHDEAIAVLREAVGAGVDHIDTSHYYGPAVVNELIRKRSPPTLRAWHWSARSVAGATRSAPSCPITIPTSSA